MNEFELSIADRVATVTINRQQQHNAITYKMWSELPDLCTRLENDSDVRIIVWMGAGDEAFSAGGDISEFRRFRSNAGQAAKYNELVDKAIKRVLKLSKPNLALIKGYCIGGGFILAAHCDLRFAADNAQFGIPTAKLGALVTYAQMQRFVRLIGLSATLNLLLRAHVMDADEAFQCQLCNQILPLAEIDDAVRNIATSMAYLSPLSQRLHKRMLQVVLDKPALDTLSAEETALLDESFDSFDYAEGVAAFLEKRQPKF